MKNLEFSAYKILRRFGGICLIALLTPLWLGLSFKTVVSLSAMIGTGLMTEHFADQLLGFYAKENLIKDLMHIGHQPLKWLLEIAIGFTLENYFQIPWETIGTLFFVDNIREIFGFFSIISNVLLKWITILKPINLNLVD